MLTHEESELLCQVEGDAPIGKLMHQHWTPVCLTEGVSEPGGVLVKACVFGEDLVVLRDNEGRVGMMGGYCPHRRVSLVYGRNEDGDLRCLYHGWKLDVLGNVLEMVPEPAASGMTEKVKYKAYPSKERGGMIWVYMGLQDTTPEFVTPVWAPTEDTRVSIAKVLLPCNWAQILEGVIDSAHGSSLHLSDFVPARVGGGEATSKNWLCLPIDKASRLQVERTEYGFRYAALRCPIFNANTHDYVRSTVFVAPGIVLISPNNPYNVADINAPMDDTSTAFYFIAQGDPATTSETETRCKFLHQQIGPDLDERYRPLRNRENRFWQDRQAMKAGNFIGIMGFPNQDIAMWVMMGPIVNRSGECLDASDPTIAGFRRRMPDTLVEFEQDTEAIGIGVKAIPQTVCSYQAVVSKETDWRVYAARYVSAKHALPEGEPAALATDYQVGQ